MTSRPGLSRGLGWDRSPVPTTQVLGRAPGGGPDWSRHLDLQGGTPDWLSPQSQGRGPASSELRDAHRASVLSLARRVLCGCPRGPRGL